MKLRIKGNSIRLRLSQSEVRRIAEEGRVEEVVEFGMLPHQRLCYAMQSDAEAADIFATYENCAITVFIPEQMVRNWATSAQVGLEKEQIIGGGKTLKLLIEKDFQCLTARTDEDESDNYPHPDAAVGHKATNCAS
ncbi:MAG: DUF7009 family protein [Candidatus Thermochlorobacter sp.]